MDNTRFRVFRRNQKNIVLIWETEGLTPDQMGNVQVNLILDNDELLHDLKFTIFVPLKKEKFKNEVTGVIINHRDNNLDTTKSYTFEIVLGLKNTVAQTINVKPFEEEVKNASVDLHLYAWDPEHNKWEKISGSRIGNKFILTFRNE